MGVPPPFDGAAILVAGRGAEARALREASALLPSWSATLDRDFLDLGAADAGEEDLGAAAGDVRILWLGGEPEAPLSPGGVLVHLGPRLALPEDPGTAWFLGARTYTREERDRARRTQRLLPLHEVDLRAAALSAAEEIGRGRPAHVVLDLELLDRPGLGPPVGDLGRAVDGLASLDIRSVRVTGAGPGGGRALLGAEVVRDLALRLWWAGR